MARLFHSLVVCGAGLTLLDCGGRFASHEPASDDGATGGSSGTSGGSGHAGSGSDAGGSPAAGGTQSSGGLQIALGGSIAASDPTAGAPSDAPHESGPPATADAQWVCDGTNMSGCADAQNAGVARSGFRLTAPCNVELSRPRSQQDCADGETFDCLLGVFNGQSLLFNCQCTPPSVCTCPELKANCGRVVDREPTSCNDQPSVCGCAWTCILK